MKDDRFCRGLARDSIGKKDGCGTLYVKNVNEVVRE